MTLTIPDHSCVDWLVLDLNSFFASCEQQHNPALRGKPVAIVPMENVDSTCVLAASYEAKRLGIKTNTSVVEARALCPDILFMKADHKRYVMFHHAILKAVESCTPIARIMSIDEVACQLTGSQRHVDNALALARRIKATIAQEVGVCLTSSIGLAPNVFLAKVASDMHKPDGLTVITQADLPHTLFTLKPQDLCGIGHNMNKRLRARGIYTMQDLYACDRQTMRRIWGGVQGERFHALLRGVDVPYQEPKKTVLGHQHVLEPRWRSAAGGLEVCRHLLIKGAERLRANDLTCRRLSVSVKLCDRGGYWWDDTNFTDMQDTHIMMAALEKMWQRGFPTAYRPLRVGITLSDLRPASTQQGDLFTSQKSPKLYKAIDRVNTKYGRATLNFGLNTYLQTSLKKDKIAFSRVPEINYVSDYNS